MTLFTLKNSTVVFALFIVSACGESSDTTLPLVNEAGATFSQTDGALSLVAGDLDVNLSLDPERNRGTFVAASGIEENVSQILAVSQTEDTFAAYLITRDGSASADSFIGRTTEFDNLPTGSATLTGTYVGSFEENVNSGLNSYISGDVTIDVNFDNLTIGGRIENRTLEAFGITGFVFDEENATILLPETDIDRNGSFVGTNEQTFINEESNGDVTVATTDFSGLIGGISADTSEAVGTVVIDSITTGQRGNTTFETTGLETGVFAVGH